MSGIEVKDQLINIFFSICFVQKMSDGEKRSATFRNLRQTPWRISATDGRFRWTPATGGGPANSNSGPTNSSDGPANYGGDLATSNNGPTNTDSFQQ